MPALPGRIGPYRVDSMIGRGGMGEVYRAWDERLERHVAIKRIRHSASSADTARARRRFQREARLAARLDHPAIVRVYELLETADGDAIVMELVEGQSVAALLRHGPLDLRLTVRLARQVAGALAQAHDSGLVHRDLKAANVMIDLRGDAKVLDFGVARPLNLEETSAMTGSDEFVGTAYATAPEQLRGRKLDVRSDLYSFGVLLYEMTTGVRPFQGKSVGETLHRVLHDPTPSARSSRPEVPEILDRWIRRMMSKDLGERPASAASVEAMLADLETRWKAPSDDAPALATTAIGSSIPEPARFDGSGGETRSGPATGAFVRATGSGWRVAGIVLVILSLGLWALGHRRSEQARGTTTPSEALRVAVLTPEIATPSEVDRDALERVGATVFTAAFDTLAAVPGLSVIDPARAAAVEAADGDPVRAHAAREEIQLQVMPWPDYGCRIELRRVAAGTGEILDTVAFEAPVGLWEQRLVANAVSFHLRGLFGLAGDAAGVFEVRDRDYVAYLEIWRTFQDEQLATSDRLEELERLIASSPRFLEAQLLATDLLLMQFSADRTADLLARARRHLAAAEELAREDPRPLLRRFRIELDAGEPEEAAAALARLERAVPGNPAVLHGRVALAEAAGHLEEARELLTRLVERRPEWTYFEHLARLEMRMGHSEAAREHLEDLLELVPHNPRVMGRLAQLELLYGDLDRSAALYRELLELGPARRSLHTNLGLVAYLRKDYAAAVAHYHEALALDPRHPVARLNLADALWALGEREAARESYRAAVAELEETERSAELPPEDALVKAQCLVRLGEIEPAVEITQRMFALHPDNSDVSYSAAVVYALAGDHVSAKIAIRRALAQDVRPRWFRIEAFDALKTDRELAVLFASYPEVPVRSEPLPPPGAGFTSPSSSTAGSPDETYSLPSGV